MTPTHPTTTHATATHATALAPVTPMKPMKPPTAPLPLLELPGGACPPAPRKSMKDKYASLRINCLSSVRRHLHFKRNH
jgi:hypothetical protein